MLRILNIPAADLTLNSDLLKKSTMPDEDLKFAPRLRVLEAVQFTGSAAEADCCIDIMAGDTLMARMWNTATGLGDRDELYPVGEIIPPNVEFKAIVRDAGGTSPAFLILKLN